MEEVNKSKVLHEQVSEMVFNAYQHFKHKMWAVEDNATHHMVSHSVVVRQKHVVSDFKPYKQF
jgi:hypothetical protein